MPSNSKKSKKSDTVKHEADRQGNLSFTSPLDMQVHTVDKAPATAMQDPNVMRMLEVERQYQGKVEECGLNMPLLLRAILHELMLLRAGKGGHK